MVTPVTWSSREKISGIISTPTATDLAVKKEPEPNFGSSEMAISSAGGTGLAGVAAGLGGGGETGFRAASGTAGFASGA